MSDNTQINAGTGGDTIRTVDRTAAKTQVMGVDFGGDTGAGNEQLVTTTNPFPVGKTGSYFVKSTANSSTAQLAPGAQFVGTIEAIPTALSLSLNIPSDQPLTVTVNGYQSSSPSSIISSQTKYVQAGVGLNLAMEANENYANVVVTNTGTATTTTLAIDAQYGDIPAQTQNGNLPVSISEIGLAGGAIPVYALSDSPVGGPLPAQAIWTGFSSGSAMTGVSPSAPLPVSDPSLSQSSTDNPISVSISGDPNGDFAGVNLLEQAMNDGSGLGLNVRLIAPVAKQDAQSALVQSDAPAPISLQGLVGSTFIIDTTGYQSLNITAETLAGTVTASNDGITWSALTGVPLVLGAYVTAVTAGAGFSFPAMARYIRLVLTTAGYGTAYLRAAPWQGIYTTSVPTSTASNNLAQVGGTAVVTGGVAGILAVGGNIAPGTARTANPLPLGGADASNLTRTLLTDSSGRAQVVDSGLDGAATARTLGMATPGNLFNVPSLIVQEGTVSDGQTLIDLMSQVLTELRIANHQLSELPFALGAGVVSMGDPALLRNDPTVFTL